MDNNIILPTSKKSNSASQILYNKPHISLRSAPVLCISTVFIRQSLLLLALHGLISLPSRFFSTYCKMASRNFHMHIFSLFTK